MLTTTPAAPADLPAAAAVLAEAFEGDAVMAAVVGRPVADRRTLERLFVPLLRCGSLRQGGLDLARRDTDGSVLGVAVWEVPGAGGQRARQALELPALLRALGLRGVLAAARVSGRLASHRPTAAHWYLAEIGVSARARGLGVGSALLESRLARLDAAGDDAYLEASNEHNRRLYLRHGFRAVTAIDGVPGARPTAMWRPAGATTPAAAPAALPPTRIG